MLYIVATPIGNLEDISTRAIKILSQVDLIACEDTRVSRKLLSSLEITTKTESLHEHSNTSKINKLIGLIKTGKSIAYITDAGTPCISDPGTELVKAAIKSDINIEAIPGPSALVAALSLSGFNPIPATFYGFPPHKKGRAKFFENITNTNHTVVMYESKHRIIKTLQALPQNRKLFVARELTKQFETHYRGIAADIITALESSSTKGEFTIVMNAK